MFLLDYLHVLIKRRKGEKRGRKKEEKEKEKCFMDSRSSLQGWLVDSILLSIDDYLLIIIFDAFVQYNRKRLSKPFLSWNTIKCYKKRQKMRIPFNGRG